MESKNSELINRMIGQRLQVARKRQKLSREKLGERVGVHRNTIARVEAGQRSPEVMTLLRICAGLGLKMATVLDGLGDGRSIAGQKGTSS